MKIKFKQLLIGRKGNMLHFKTGTCYATSCSGKVLTSLQTGQELCFVYYRGARIKLDASYYMTGVRKITQERPNLLGRGYELNYIKGSESLISM